MRSERTPYYLAADLIRAQGEFRPARFMNASVGRATLREHARAVDVWGGYLPHYRSVRCQPLDFAYSALQALGALDDPMLDDLLGWCLNWRGVIFGAWLCVLRPRAEDGPRLAPLRPKLHERNRWIIDLALAGIEGTRPDDLAEHLDLRARIRAALDPVAKPVVRLRRSRDFPARREQALRDAVRERYRAEGAAAAHAYLLEARARGSFFAGQDRRLDVAGREDGAGAPWFWGLDAPAPAVLIPTRLSLAASTSRRRPPGSRRSPR